MDKIERHSGPLFLRVLLRLLAVLLGLGALLFGTAGSLAYWQGWLYLGTICLTMGLGFALLYRRDKSLLEKRIGTSEKDPAQRLFVALSALLILAIYSLPGLDYRFGWSAVPPALVGLGELLVVAGYALNLAVMLTNSYASRTVEIQEGQRVIDTGPYALVRHPMYAAMIPIYVGSCLALGSYPALIAAALLIVALGFRALREEKTLVEGLPGYADYRRRVRYRFIPFVW